MFFLKAFTGGFKVRLSLYIQVSVLIQTVQEATSPTIDFHDDDPEHFMVALQYMYTDDTKREELLKTTAAASECTITFLTGVARVGDKYDIAGL